MTAIFIASPIDTLPLVGPRLPGLGCRCDFEQPAVEQRDRARIALSDEELLRRVHRRVLRRRNRCTMVGNARGSSSCSSAVAVSLVRVSPWKSTVGLPGSSGGPEAPHLPPEALEARPRLGHGAIDGEVLVGQQPGGLGLRAHRVKERTGNVAPSSRSRFLLKVAGDQMGGNCSGESTGDPCPNTDAHTAATTA
jgi:hypothetical protein